MDYFNIGLNSSCLLVQSIMHIFFVSSLTGKVRKVWHFFVYLILLAGLEWIAGQTAADWMLVIGAETAVLYMMSRFGLGNGHAASWIAAILAVYVSQLSFGMINSAETLLFPYCVGSPMLYVLIILATAAAFAVSTGCYVMILKFVSLKKDSQTSDIGFLLLPVLFFFASELYIIQTEYTQIFYQDLFPAHMLDEAEKQTALFSLQALGLGALLCTLYAYQRICRGFQMKAALSSLTQAVETQKAYISEAQVRYDKTRAFRHDIKNHLSVLSGLLNHGKYEEGEAYLKKLQIVSDTLSSPCQTGNPIVDIVLGEKLRMAEADGITTEISLCLPKSCKIDDFDLCVIFANALDNAVNACRFVEEGKFLRITGERQGDFYMLGFENRCLEGPLPPMGIGLSNIKTVAEKYHGAVMTEKSGDRFYLNVLLNVSTYEGEI